MQYLLHIDTATDKGTIAISGDGTLLAQRTNEETRNHAGTINIMINEVMADAKISPEQLSAVVACAGPGSYTGLRIGVATAKGLCYALDKPLLLHNRLTLLAFHAFMQKNISASQYVTLLVARDKEFFISAYNKDFICTLPPQHIMQEQLHEIIEKNEHTYFITDVSEAIINSLGITNLQIDTNVYTSLDSWAFYAFDDFKCNNIVNLSSAEPFYLKQVYTHK